VAVVEERALRIQATIKIFILVLWLAVGSYGTRNIVVIGMMVLERPTECIVLSLDLSSILRGIPLSGGIRLALSLRP
jgi:hypothetical protein